MGDVVVSDEEHKVPLVKPPRGPVIIEIRGWYPIVVLGLVMILITAGNIIYTNHVDSERRAAEREALAAVQATEREADRRWCTLMTLLDGAYNNPATPPTSELGRAVAKAVRDIRVDLGC
jgi:hypothetical protein